MKVQKFKQQKLFRTIKNKQVKRRITKTGTVTHMSQKKIEEGMTKPKNSLQKWFVHCSTENINLIDFGARTEEKIFES